MSKQHFDDESSGTTKIELNAPATASILFVVAAWLASIISGVSRWLPGSFISGALVLIAIPLGIWGLRRAKYRKIPGKGLAIGGLAAAGVTLVVPFLLWWYVSNLREDAALKVEVNRLKLSGLGMHNHHSSTGSIVPTVYDYETERFNAGLSWRVQLLPFHEAAALHRKFRLTEPWDSPANRPLAEYQIRQYHSPYDPHDSVQTRYHIFVGGGALFEDGKLSSFDDVPDGTANTIMLVEAREASPWPQPFNLKYSRDRPIPPLGREKANGFMVLMADGSTRFVRTDVSEATLRAAITAAGQDTVGNDWPKQK